VVATDASAAAVELTRINAAASGVGHLVAPILGVGLAPILAIDPRPSVLALVVNPPYVTAAEMGGLAPDIARHEPRLALEAGVDGLDVMREVAAGARPILVPGGLLAMEIGINQGSTVRELLDQAGWVHIRIESDLTGRDRYALARSPALVGAGPAEGTGGPTG
jgi:release factor glutamine methyltransferase